MPDESRFARLVPRRIARRAADALRLEEALGTPSERRTVLALMLATVLVPLNSLSTVVALPDIGADLDASRAATSWLVTVYLVVMIAFQSLGGKLGDRFPRRTVLLAGLAAFGAASLAMVLATSLGQLIGCRLAQAAAGAVVAPNALAFVRERGSQRALATRLGIVQSGNSIGAIAGAPLAGVLLAVGDWRLVFLVNLPLAAAAVLAVATAVPRAAAAARPGPFDALGGALLCAVLVPAALLATLPAQDPAVYAAGAGAIAAAAAALAAVERRRPDPVVPVALLRRSSFVGAAGGVAFSNVALYAALIQLPFAAADAGAGEAGAGLVTMALPAAAVVASPLGWMLVTRGIRRAAAGGGVAALAAGVLVVARAADAGSWPLLALGAVVAGAGLGVAWAALQTVMLEDAEPADAGSALGTFSSLRYAGGVVGTSLVAAADALAVAGVAAVAALACCLALSAAAPRTSPSPTPGAYGRTPP
jgi:MFS family permease